MKSSEIQERPPVLSAVVTHDPFGDAVASFGTAWLLPDKAAYVASEERVREANLVDSLVRKFADYELRPSTHGAPRAIGMARIGPPLGQVLGKAWRGADHRTTEGARGAIVAALAAGYGYLASLELDVGPQHGPVRLVADRSVEAIWAFWVSNFREPILKEFGVPTDVMTAMRDIAESELLRGLDRVGLKPRLRRRTRLGILGITYGDAGAALRMSQTTAITDARLSQGGRLGLTIDITDILERWPIE